MYKTSVLHAPSWAHQGEFLASGTIYPFTGCVEDTVDTTGGDGVTYLQNVHYLKQISSAADASDAAKIVYLAYKWPTEDDYLERNGLSANYITDGEGVIGLKLIPGIRLQAYSGTDYTGLLDTAVTWSSVSAGTLLYFNNSGQLTTDSANVVPRAQFIEAKGDWVTVEII